MPAENHPHPLIPRSLELEIDPDEQVRWHGTPDVTEYVTANLIPAALLASAFSFFCLLFLSVSLLDLAKALNWLTASQQPPPTVAGSLTACGIAIGLLIATGGGVYVFARILRRRAGRVVYALTNTRLMTITTTDGRPVVVHSIEPAHPLIIKRTDSSSGLGSINLFPSTNGVASFEWHGVSEPRRVEQLIRHTFDPPPPTSEPLPTAPGHPETSR